ncbi:MAG TPA: lipid-binding SYLF domain-containing protein [Blastocatellia bacterium]|nr:lipid-binding SYLF domain-containing protein [Blastocatellia bacterium]
MKRLIVTSLALAVGLALGARTAGAGEKEERERAQKASDAFSEMMKAPDAQAVPQELIDRCECIAVFPSVKKGGFVVGGQYGKGLISCRRANGAWGSPSYFTIGGGSFGLQIGAQAVDLLLLIMNKEGLESLLKGKVELGAGASASAGPVGRNAAASTDVLMKAEILSYSRSRGLFAGLELKGSVITEDKDANKDIYGRELSARDIILDGKARTPAAINIYPRTLMKYSPRRMANKK